MRLFGTRGGFTPFRERNPITIGAVSLAVIALLMLVAFKAQDLPLIGGGTRYYADFAEAGGLKTGDEVRIAGVRVGKVDKIELEGGHVRVGFRLKTDSAFGTETRAAIKVKTILGAMFVALEPAGSGQLKEGTEIPVERTTSPYDVVQAFTGLANTAGDIDTDQLAAALTTLSDLTRTTPDSFKQALDGVAALSKNLAAKDAQIGTLLTNLQRVSQVLDERDGDIVALMKDADSVFQALVARRQAVHDLLTSTSSLSAQLSGLIKESRADLNPALTQVQSVLGVLDKNMDNLDESLRLMAPFYRIFSNVLGNGPWFDSYIQNIPPVPAAG
ncbi:MCE family protein [Nocardioides sp. Kera G14]|uniref:MCE family protein n=1 Tax=Nocardioides sp. Kera G14 TaxID=2884264 RepID=UPI001D1069F7|nr:MCE family protein [Nocardioides sp. Kera G14]UDY23972.1 MCE family protein [Nocardioides sp. Kera G14]